MQIQAINITKFSLLIAIRTGNYQNLISAYDFTVASLSNPKIILNMIFFYQEAVVILNYPDLKTLWTKILLENFVPHGICQAACKHRGVEFAEPFKYASILEFTQKCELADRIIQF